MDVVYACKSGPNEPLRYSLRSLENVNHGAVWIFGDPPDWVNANVVQRGTAGSKYETVTEHIKAACEHPEISDPFMFWNDDFFAVQPVGNMPLLHRGPLAYEVAKFASRRDEWGRSLRGAAMMLPDVVPGVLLSYELHVPLVVYKDEMLRAIAMIRSVGIPSACRRTVYGNLAGLGGNRIPDPKVNREWPIGPWVSSHPATFSALVLPRLRELFPSSGPYEKAL
jgi:hypothetical protein